MIVRLLFQILAMLKSICRKLNWQTVLLIEMDVKLDRIIAAVTADAAVSVVFDVEVEGQITQGAKNVTIKDTQKFTASVVFMDAKGNPAAVDGVPTWVGSNDPAFTVAPAADGLSAVVTAGNIGAGQVTVSADADLGAGVTTITGTLDVSVIAGDAVTVQINTAPPENQ